MSVVGMKGGGFVSESCVLFWHSKLLCGPSNDVRIDGWMNGWSVHVRFVHAIEDSHLINHQTRDLNYCIVMHTKRRKLGYRKKKKNFPKSGGKRYFGLQTDAAQYLLDKWRKLHSSSFSALHANAQSWYFCLEKPFYAPFSVRSHQFYTPALHYMHGLIQR